jgi:hypothetical protein
MNKIIMIIGLSFLLSSLELHAESIKPIAVKSFAKLMKEAIAAKDAPASCWYLGMSEGYLRAMKNSGNEKAASGLNNLQNAEGKCGGKNSMDLATTFTKEEWLRLSDVQKRIESLDL